MTRADFVILWDNFSNDKTLLLSHDFVRYCYRGKQKNGAQLFFTSNIENYIIKGELTDEVSPELVELLHYIEHTTQDMADGCKSERIHKMQKRICSIKSSEEVSVRYMQRWEEMEMEKEAARELGLAEGRTQGLAEGRAEGRSSMARLIDKLLEENRIEDCKRIAKDPEFCQHLMEEFGIE